MTARRFPFRRARGRAPLAGIVICDGNSLTQGYLASGPSGTYPAQLQALLPPAVVVSNFGVGGQTSELMEADAAAQVDVLYDASKSVNIVAAWEVGNSRTVIPETADQAVDAFKLYCQHRRAAGFLVIAVTVPSRAGAAFVTDLQYMNARLRSELATYADALADAGNDANIGQDGQYANTTYFPDGTHMTDAGYGIVAAWVKAAFDGLFEVVAAPTGLGDSTSKAAVVLSWLPVFGANSYTIQRSTSSSGPWTTLSAAATAVTLTGGRQKPTYSDATNDDAPGTYYYRVASNTRAGTGPYTSAYSVVVPALAAPAGPSATPGDATANLSWSAVTNAAGYKVYRSTTSGSGYTLITSPSGTTYLDTGLTNGTTYYYVITATDAGSESAQSSQVSALPFAEPLLTDLTAYWKLEETGSSNRVDATGRGNVIYAGSSIPSATGIQGSGSSFTSSSETMYRTTTSDTEASATFTCDFWIKFSSVITGSGANGSIIGRWGGIANDWLVYTTGNGTGAKWATLVYGTGGGLTSATAGAYGDIVTGQWYYVCLRCNGTSVKLDVRSTGAYSVQGSNTGANNPRATSGGPLYINGNTHTAGQTGAVIDEVGFWHRALTDAEVTRRYNSGSGNTYPTF